MEGFCVVTEKSVDKVFVRFCPFCGTSRENLMFIAESSPEIEVRSEDWRCDVCGTFFTITDVAREE